MTLTGNLEYKFKKSLYPRIRPSQAEHLSEADLFGIENEINSNKRKKRYQSQPTLFDQNFVIFFIWFTFNRICQFVIDNQYAGKFF